jgi:hypothetical protein
VPILDASHDFAHDVEGDTAWSESYYFNGYDASVDAGLFTRIGVRPNEGTIDVGLSAWLPGDRIANVRGVREQTVMTDSDLDVGGVRYDRLEPMRRWRITADADAEVLDLAPPAGADARLGRSRLTIDLTFTALTPAVGNDGGGRQQRSDDTAVSTAATVGKGHLEQAGGWAGTIALDGDNWTLDPSSARGNRDKSWGPRRWGGPQMWRWFSINIPGTGDDAGTHFGGIRIGTPAGDLHRGWVWRDGEAVSIRRWDVTSELAGDGVTHRVSHVRATDKRGRMHELRGDVLRVYGVPHRTGDRATLVNEGLARWTYEGRTGYGITEYLHQLDDSGRPLVAIE